MSKPSERHLSLLAAHEEHGRDNKQSKSKAREKLRYNSYIYQRFQWRSLVYRVVTCTIGNLFRLTVVHTGIKAPTLQNVIAFLEFFHHLYINLMLAVPFSCCCVDLVGFWIPGVNGGGVIRVGGCLSRLSLGVSTIVFCLG